MKLLAQADFSVKGKRSTNSRQQLYTFFLCCKKIGYALPKDLRVIFSVLLRAPKVLSVPICREENIATPSERMSWSNVTLFAAMCKIKPPKYDESGPLRVLGHTWYRIGGIGYVCCAKILSGTLRVGDELSCSLMSKDKSVLVNGKVFSCCFFWVTKSHFPPVKVSLRCEGFFFFCFTCETDRWKGSNLVWYVWSKFCNPVQISRCARWASCRGKSGPECDKHYELPLEQRQRIRHYQKGRNDNLESQRWHHESKCQRYRCCENVPLRWKANSRKTNSDVLHFVHQSNFYCVESPR